MVEYEIDVDNTQLVQAMRQWERQMPDFTRMLMARFAQAISARAAERSRKVLNVITGRLSTSIFGRTRGSDTAIVGAGSNVSYARVHEFGFSGTQMVRAHTRSMVFGRSVEPFTVPGFSRRMTIQPRPYVKPSIQDFFRGGDAEEIARGLFEGQKRRYGFE